MARRAAYGVWAVLLIGAVWLAGTRSGWAQAAAEAAAAGAQSTSAAGGAKSTGNALGAALARTGAKLDEATSAVTPASSTAPKGTKGQRATVTPASTPISARPGINAVVGPPPRIHFDVVSFKRCAVAGSSEADLPADADYVAYHCQPLLRMIDFAYNAATSPNSSLSGYPSWVATDLYDLDAKVAPEDFDTWQRMDLNARRVAVRALLTVALKLQIHADTTPKPVSAPEAGKAQVAGIVVDHIERPAED